MILNSLRTHVQWPVVVDFNITELRKSKFCIWL